jgi:hypothetical protein
LVKYDSRPQVATRSRSSFRGGEANYHECKWLIALEFKEGCEHDSINSKFWDRIQHVEGYDTKCPIEKLESI